MTQGEGSRRERQPLLRRARTALLNQPESPEEGAVGPPTEDAASSVSDRDPAARRSWDAAAGGAELARSVAVAAERIEEIIAAAERVAEDIRGDAQAEAERYLADRRREADRLVEDRARRLSEVLGGLRSPLRSLEQQAAEMLRTLDQVVEDANIAAAPDRPAEPPEPESEEDQAPELEEPEQAEERK